MTEQEAVGAGPQGRVCSGCGRSLAPNAVFCRSCGTKHEPKGPGPEASKLQAGAQPQGPETAPCRECGAALALNAAFCRSCGTPVETEGPPTEATAPGPPLPLAATVPSPSPPTPPASPPIPPSPTRSKRSIVPFALAAIVLLIGAGVAAAILLGKGSDPSETVATVEQIATPGAEAGFEEEGSAGTEEIEEEASEEVESEAESVTSRGFPTVARGQMDEEITSLLRDYHEDVVEENFQGAWALLSARKRQQDLAEYGYRKWAVAQASLTPYLRPYELEAYVVALEDDGVARVEVTGMEWDKPGAPCSEWSGLTWVRYERGVWTYDPGYSTTSDRRAVWQARSDRLLGAACAE